LSHTSSDWIGQRASQAPRASAGKLRQLLNTHAAPDGAVSRPHSASQEPYQVAAFIRSAQPPTLLVSCTDDASPTTYGGSVTTRSAARIRGRMSRMSPWQMLIPSRS
jgi:hypothetical protein